MIVLDTNVISELFRPQPDVHMAAWLDAQLLETLYLTTVTVAEIRFGVACLPHGHRRDDLERRVEEELFPLFLGRILNLDEAATVEYAVRRASARQRGLGVSSFDALIAAIGASRGFAVATRDTTPFVAMGVDVVNPFE